MLFERDKLLDALEKALERVRAGQGSIILLEGEAGSGKSTLIDAFLRARARDLTVLLGGCDALLAPRPFGPLFDIARTAGGELRRALENGVSRYEVFSRFLDVLAARPCIVVLEDIHWADQATLSLLKFIGRRIAGTRALLILSFRDDVLDHKHPLHSMLADLPRAASLRLIVECLSRSAVDEMARAAGRPVTGVYERTGGNPFLVVEHLASAPATVPRSIREQICARAQALSTAGRDALELVAVVPGRVRTALVERALASESRGIDECISAGLLCADGDSTAFRHELLREAFYESLPPQYRQALHGRIMEVMLADAGAPLAYVVHQATLAGRADIVLRLAPQAGCEASARGAHREAAEHYSAALRWADRLGPRERMQLLDAAAFEYYLTSEMQRALGLRQEQLAIARQLGDTDDIVRLLCLLSRIEWFMGLRREAEQHAEDALAALPPAPTGKTAAGALGNRAQLQMLAGEFEQACEWGERALQLATAAADHAMRAATLNTLGVARLMRGESAGRALIEQSLELAAANGLEEHVARAWSNLAWTALFRGEDATASRAIEKGLAYCTEHDLDAGRMFLLGWRAELEVGRGRWREAALDAEGVAKRTGLPLQLRLPALLALARHRVRTGGAAALELLYELVSLAATTQEPARLLPLAAIAAEHAFHVNDRALMQRACALAAPWSARAIYPWAQGELAYWASKVLPQELPVEQVTGPWALLLQGDAGAAAECWRDSARPYERAIALATGSAARRREALDEFDRLGAIPMASRLRRELRAAGIRVLPRGPRAATRANPWSLTGREIQILRLLDLSLRDAQIAQRLHLSVKTVSHHVSSILAKLEAHSRLEAVALARVRGVLGAAATPAAEKARAGRSAN